MNDQNMKDALMSVRLDEEKKGAMKGALLAAAPDARILMTRVTISLADQRS